MRVRIYISPAKGTEEAHMDYTPPYRNHPGTLRICCGSTFLAKTDEIVQAAEVIRILDNTLARDC